MRFAELHLERYGHFEDRRLPFQDRAPDFHMVYGANEAGKSTTLSAVSDLLFGFPTRSLFNFRFDYALLRVGAVLEEDGRRLVCRRRKSRDHSLIDATEQPLDEGQLSALLHGLNRDTFGAGFSLDQARLRSGGDAMLQATDDLGQALFAAGSGLTEIAKVREALDAELDGIRGKRASAKRTFVVAERQLDACTKSMRDSQLKPREWSEAQAAVEACEQALRDVQNKQDAVIAERNAAERLRRIGAAVRSRAALLAALAEHGPAVVFSPTEDATAQSALAALAKATDAHDAAKRRRDDVMERLAPLHPDFITELGARIERLIETRGAVTKALADLTRLDLEQQGLTTRAAVLREELALPDGLPSGLEVRTLRDIAKRHASIVASQRTRDSALHELRARAQSLREELADAVVADGLDGLRAGVALARGLGDDIDHRCSEAQDSAQQAQTNAQTALAALAPWQGDADGLAALCAMDDSEIQAASDAELTLATRLDTERSELRRLDNEIAQLDAQRSLLAQTGQAVSADDVRQARDIRDGVWRGIDAHMREGGPAAADPALADRFASAVRHADAIADRRYETAEASARLAALDHSRVLQDLQRQQTHSALRAVEESIATLRRGWEDRLQAQGLPPLPPLRLRSWCAQRRTALDRHREAVEARQQAVRLQKRRAEAVEALSIILNAAPETDRLAPVLAAASGSGWLEKPWNRRSVTRARSGSPWMRRLPVRNGWRSRTAGRSRRSSRNGPKRRHDCASRRTSPASITGSNWSKNCAARSTRWPRTTGELTASSGTARRSMPR